MGHGLSVELLLAPSGSARVQPLAGGVFAGRPGLKRPLQEVEGVALGLSPSPEAIPHRICLRLPHSLSSRIDRAP